MSNNLVRIAVFIDGSNLYYKLKDLKIKNKTRFDYLGLCNYLSKGEKLISCRYYVGAVRAKSGDAKSQEMRSNQQKLFDHLIEQGFVIERGYLMSDGKKFHEKGVDVKIATDLLIGAYENYYDEAILISSDTDLIPAIKQIRKLKKIIEYAGFSHSPSLGLQKNVDKTKLLKIDEIRQFEIFNWPNL
jgi:Uncharacterized conserved protein